MKVLSYDEFKQFYQKYGKTINQMNRPKNSLNENQIESLYNKYLKQQKKLKIKQEKEFEKYKEEVKEPEVDEKWEEVRNKVFKRDNYHCQLQKILTFEELTDFNLSSPSDLRRILDPCHIFGKGVFPHLKYDKDNIVIMNRYSHSCIDQYRNPVNGENISKGQREKWWIRIIGVHRYFKLEKKAYKETN